MQVIEKELLERLNKGVYPDICNYNEEIFNKLLDKNKEEEQEEEDEVYFISFYLMIELVHLCHVFMIHSFYLCDQEAEVEYVEGDYELEEEEELEDDIEDMGDFLNANSFGNKLSFSFTCQFSHVYAHMVKCLV